MGQISTRKNKTQESALFAQRLTVFLSRYYVLSPQFFQADGTLLPHVARRGLEQLLEAKIFFTVKSLRETALWEQELIIPWDYLERAQ